MKTSQKIKETLENPKVRTILLLLGVGTFIAGSFLIPTLPMAAKPIIDFRKRKRREEETRQWVRFNQYRLRQMLKRLYQQKMVAISTENGEASIKLTDKGKVKFLKYKLEDLMINHPPKWDGKWRLIIYDIPKQKRVLSEIFRGFLRQLEFLKLQKSVYITPYACENQIEFLRQYYNLGEEVIYVIAQKIENEQIYKGYFGL